MNINKEVFLHAVNCPAYAWQLRNGVAKPKLSDLDRFRMEEGKEVQALARKVLPGGKSAGVPSFDEAKELTQKYIEDPDISIIYEATFQVGSYTTKADVLEALEHGWHLIEIKSKTNDDADLMEDLAYTAMVLGRAGLRIEKASLMILSKDYRLGMNEDDLFVRIDKTEELPEHVIFFDSKWDEVDRITSQNEQPKHEITFECKDCPITEETLAGYKEDHILILPRLSKKKYTDLNQIGILWVKDIPDSFDLTPPQTMVANAIKSGKPYIGSDLRNSLDAIAYPAGYLDFETVSTAVPLYEGIGPYQHVPVQYSLHMRQSPDEESAHFELLCNHDADERRELAESLIKHLEPVSSIIVYSHFEKTTLNSLKREFPELATEFDQILNKLIDLKLIIEKSFVHPEFKGRTSIKVTLPVLVPSLSYDELEIGEGSSALVNYALLRRGNFTGEKIQAVKAQLREYCKLDTLAMVKLHDALLEIAG